MKKILFMAAMAACMGAMTSCSQEEDIVPSSSIDSNTIVFATNSPKAKLKTRSAETVNSISQFTVSAVNPDKTPYFSGVQFNYNGGLGVFK